jgi:hypothetical protein
MNKIKMSVAVALLAASSVAVADEADVKALEQACEAAREVKLKPLREAEIARCKAEGRNDAAYCERYWSDYGNAIRLPNGTMQPRMFDDLPECVAAEEARRKLSSTR